MQVYFESESRNIYTTYAKQSYAFDSHFHSKLEAVYCFSGVQGLRIGDTRYSLKRGEAAVIFPNMVHEYFADTAAPATETISLICKLEFLSEIFPDLMKKRPLSPLIPAEAVSKNAIFAFEQMRTAKNEAALWGWTFVALSDLLNTMNLIPVKESDGFSLAPNIVTYINANFQQPLTIKHLATEFGYSTSYVTHVFYEQLKIPFRTYLGAVRSEHAASLIRSTNKTLTEIAYECGYSSLNTFCRCFKKHFSQTPSEYKKSVPK